MLLNSSFNIKGNIFNPMFDLGENKIGERFDAWQIYGVVAIRFTLF